MSYSFEHGIDHCGRYGVAPILAVGGPISERDFDERDLLAMRGVLISQRGLSKGIRWKDLNLKLLFQRLTHLEYITISFDGAVDLSDLGVQPFLKIAELICPKAMPARNDSFPRLERVEARWPDKCTSQLLGASVKYLVLIRPQIADLSSLAHLKGILHLDIHYASRLESLTGLEEFPPIEFLGLHDCPKLAQVGLAGQFPGAEEIVFGGCKSLNDLRGLEGAKCLRKLSALGGSPDLIVPEGLRHRTIEIDIR